jgi:hypothetical protein
MDDQTYFWKILRSKNELEILPLGACAHQHHPHITTTPATTNTNTMNTTLTNPTIESTNHTVDQQIERLTICMLDSCLFSSSMLSSINAWHLLSKHLHDSVYQHSPHPSQLQHHLHHHIIPSTPITLHANFIRLKEKKLEAIKSVGLSLYNELTTTCDSHWNLTTWWNHTTMKNIINR